ncbi:hypothetical protein GQ457_11G010000 [Hibiscus cannabinus]
MTATMQSHSNSMPNASFSVFIFLLSFDTFIQKPLLQFRSSHSAGSLVAVDAYFEAPERVAALILVAPAILAPRAIPKPKVVETKGDRSDSNNLPKPRFSVFGGLFKFIKYVRQAILQMIMRMTNMLSSLYKKALSCILRSAFCVMLVLTLCVDKFCQSKWILLILANQITSAKQPGSALQLCVNHYVRMIIDKFGVAAPLRTKGWDKALVEFTAAMLLKGESKTKPPLQNVMVSLLSSDCHTGDTDRIVPSWNAKRLSRAIPRSKLEVIKNCGHLPQEERVDEFVRIVDKFLQRAFGGLEEHFVQAVT